jgi:hypothetical protein
VCDKVADTYVERERQEGALLSECAVDRPWPEGLSSVAEVEDGAADDAGKEERLPEPNDHPAKLAECGELIGFSKLSSRSSHEQQSVGPAMTGKYRFPHPWATAGVVGAQILVGVVAVQVAQVQQQQAIGPYAS